jgi:hypothetical protein
VKVDQRATIGTPRCRRVIDPNRDRPVRAPEAEVLDLANRGHHLVAKGIVRPPLDVHRLVSAKHRPGLQPLGNLRIFRAAVHFVRNGPRVKNVRVG